MFKLGFEDIRIPSLGKVIVFTLTMVAILWAVRSFAPAGIKKFFTV